MLVKLEKCNNIEAGSVEIIEKTLNLKYAVNGSGKTTIARAILAAIDEKSGKQKDALSALTPFKYRKGEATTPVVTGTEKIQSVKVFDEKYINEFIFQSDELIKGSFDIFIKGEPYEKGMKEIEAHVAAMQQALSADEDIASLISDFTEISGSFGKDTKSGIHGSSGLAKAFKGGNPVNNIPAGLEPFTSFIRHSENYKWVQWQLGGTKFIDIGSDCPYCTNDIKDKRETIKRVSEVYEPKAIENINKIVSAFQRLDKYFSQDTRAKISEFVSSMDGYTADQESYLKVVKEQIDRLCSKFLAAQRLGFSSLKDVDKITNGLNEHKIDLSLFPHLNSEGTKQKADIVNLVIEKLLLQAGQLQGLVNKQKLLVEGLVKEHSAGINAFLLNAGYFYQVALTDNAAGQPQLKLIHRDLEGALANVKLHLSYGERNAFALVLFMYDALKSDPDLIVLDDPISSFDKSKKYAIIDMLFRKGNGALSNKTVLLLTHDLEPVVDMLVHHTDHFKKPVATFLQNDRGILTERKFERTDIKTFIEIVNHNINANCHDLNKLIYLRRRCEVANDKGLGFQIISNILHKRLTPKLIDGGQLRDMTAQEFQEGCSAVASSIPTFNYPALLELATNDKQMIALYNSSDSNYEKLHIYRILFKGKNAGIESFIVKKFINETFHIENDYIYQLNPREFQTVPHFVIAQCNLHVEELTQSAN